MEPLLRGHPDERPTPLERPLNTVNLNLNVLTSTPDEIEIQDIKGLPALLSISLRRSE